MLKNKDVMSIILMKLNDKDLYNFCQINKRANKLCDDHFWRNRLWKYYGEFYPQDGQTCKNLYLKLVYLIKEYNYIKDNKSLRKASEKGHLEVVKYLMSLPDKIDPSAENNFAIRWASLYGHLEVVKYLMSLPKEYGIDPSVKDNEAIRWASLYGNLEVVKYLMSLPKEYGIDPSADNNYAIRCANYYKGSKVVKYLLSLPKEHGIHLINN